MISPDRLAKGLYWQAAWKLVEGCTKVSPGCANCWSETETAMRVDHPNRKISDRAHQVMGGMDAKKFDGTILCREDNLDLPLRTKRPTVWAIWNDLYHEDVPEAFRDRAYAVMALCPQHTFLVLTKRAERMAEYAVGLVGRYVLRLSRGVNEVGDLAIEAADAPNRHDINWPLPNVWHGVTGENQEQANIRGHALRNVPGNTFLSIEPMLEEIDLYRGGFSLLQNLKSPQGKKYKAINAVILGGESGPNARPMHPNWARSVRDQCAAAGVPFFFKQWGEWTPYPGDYLGPKLSPEKVNWVAESGKTWVVGTYTAEEDAVLTNRIGKRFAGRLLDGRTHDDLPWLKSAE